ncbi:efflux RND transporter periplasmic adaptor subunit [Candidatus Gracilibacteria bacterium]|nr:efflux RND transporter periplasmic adaptor subunit [Candidatus Gracilibacteria bacterium]MCF7898864.1 efflux RND transporter periplasmic adaptor subunit [Candidatus Paceibacterota bacterium]
MYTNIIHSTNMFFKNTLYSLSRKPGIASMIGVCLLGIVVYSFFFTSKIEVETEIVKIGELKQYVEVTGQVQASRDASLSFQTLGSVSYVGVKVGSEVTQGRVLATLQSGDAQASLLQAKAQLESAQATLGQLTQGARKEEIAIKQQVVDNAKNTLEQSYISLPDTIRSVDSTTADIIKNKLSSLFVRNSDHYTLSFSSCDQSLQSSIETSRSNLENTLADYQKRSSVISVISQEKDIDEVFELAYKATIATNNLITSVSNLLLLSCSTQNTSLDATRATLSTARTTMNTLFTDITAKRSALSVSKNALSQAMRDLELSTAGTDPYKLKAQAAAVTQAEAQVASAESGLRKTMIIAPFSGTISDVSITEGETVTSGKVVINMLAIDAFEIEAKVPEIDIVKIKSGAVVDVTLDAYGKGIIFPATVTRVNPTATIEGSVPMYKVIVTFIGKDVRIKSGMTANVNIITENKSQIITLPARFVNVKNSINGSVILRKDNEDTMKDVVLGVRGQGGLIEIVSGLIPGDEVVAPSTGIRSAQKQTQ